MADIDRLMKTMSNRHYRICADLERQRKDTIKLIAEIDERGKLIDTLATENERLREFARLAQVEWTLLESAESEGVVRVEYPCAVHIKMKELTDEALNLPTNG